MGRNDGALMSAENPALEETHHAMHARHSDMSGIAGRGKYGFLVQISTISQTVVAAPTIRMHGRSLGRDVADEGRSQESIVKNVVQLIRDRIGAVASFKQAVIMNRLPKTR